MNVAVSEQRCLLILPRGFYGFASVLAGALQAQGYTTTVANDEYPENTFGKIISKLGLPLAHALTRRVLFRQYLQGRQYELILVIKGRGLDAATVALLKQHGRSVVGYHFDAFRFDRGPLRWRHQLARVCTFDYRDAREQGLPLVELFTSMPASTPTATRRYRVSAILRNHSQRLAYLDQVLTAMDADGDRGERFIHILEANIFSLLSNFLRHPLLYVKYRRFIARQTLPYAQYAAVIADSELTIDYAHPSQTGITIRCFEALGAGTRIITNNASVLKSAWFDADHAIVLPPGADGSELARQLRLRRPGPATARSRSVDTFLRELIDGARAETMPGPAPIPISHTTP